MRSDINQAPVADAATATGGARTSNAESPEIGVLRRFRLIYQAIQRHSLRVEQSCGVTAAQLWAIWELGRAPGSSVSELSRALMIHPSTASNLLDKLEDKELVERRREGPDQRVVRLYPTAAARRLLDQAPRPAQGALMDALQRMSAPELAALRSSLERLVDRLSVPEDPSRLSPVINRQPG